MSNMQWPSTSRREFIGGLATALLSLSAPTACRASVQSPPDGLLETCIFAWQDACAAEGRIDFWTAQLGMVDAFGLPASARLIVMWSDIGASRAIDARVSETKRAIADYFGIGVREDGSNSATFIEGEERLPEVLSAACAKCSTGSIALVDLSSCGMSRVDWLDIIPLLKRSYERVIGVDYAVPELDLLDSDLQTSGCPTDFRSWNSLMACDGFSMVSDDLLSPDPVASYEERAELYTAHVSGLIADLLSERGSRIQEGTQRKHEESWNDWCGATVSR